MSEATFTDREGQTREFNFVAFAHDPAYREANRRLLARALSWLPSPFFHVDVASGTGLVPQEMSALCQENGKQGTIIGVDPDRFAMESAARHTPATPNCRIEFVEGYAQDLAQLLAGKMPPAGVDYASIHDALHEIEEEDKQSVLASMASILRAGGFFSYNSAFTTIGMDACPMLWGRWKARAFSILGAKRDRNVKGLITHTPEEYREMITGVGLAVVYEARQTVTMCRSALEAIASYPRFIYGVFADMVDESSVALEDKSRALIQALDDLGISQADRIWHELVARKPTPDAVTL